MGSLCRTPFLRPLPRLRPPSSVQNTLRSLTTTPASPPIQESPIEQSESASRSPEAFQSLTYHVHRTPSQQLPVYHLAKASGGQHLTRIRKIEGSLGDLRNDLKKALQLDDRHIMINQLTKHIIIKASPKLRKR